MLESLQLSPFGLMHTIISLIAVAAGFAELARHRDIHPSRFLGTNSSDCATTAAKRLQSDFSARVVRV